MTLLAAESISKYFGGISALVDVDLHVEPGESVGLVGPNGAGKTTLFNCLLGVLRPERGRVWFRGRELSHTPVHDRARLGLGRTFQRLEVFSGMSVHDHFIVADRARRKRGGLFSDLFGQGGPTVREEARAEAMANLVGLGDLRDAPVESLSLGHARLVELGRALLTEPKLLMLDEPSSGLDRSESLAMANILSLVQQERGTAILLVEHDLELVSLATSRLYVLEFGEMLATGPTAAVLAHPVVRRAYVGDVA